MFGMYNCWRQNQCLLTGKTQITDITSQEFPWHAISSLSTSIESVKKEPVGQKPTFIQPLVSCTVPHGEVARFYSCVSGFPKPEISWFHGQEPVKPNKNTVFHFDEMTNTATLIIVDAFSEHAGEYTCKATNPAGEAVCTATLTISTEGNPHKIRLPSSNNAPWLTASEHFFLNWILSPNVRFFRHSY